jgi:hypothetical protein
MPLVEGTRDAVLLVRVQPQSEGLATLGVFDESSPKATSLLTRIDVEPVDVGALHREESDHPRSDGGNPHVAARKDDLPEDPARFVRLECLPRRKVDVGGSPGTVPYGGHGALVVRLVASDEPAAAGRQALGERPREMAPNLGIGATLGVEVVAEARDELGERSHFPGPGRKNPQAAHDLGPVQLPARGHQRLTRRQYDS